MDNPTTDTVMNKRSGPSHKSSGTDDIAYCSKLLLFFHSQISSYISRKTTQSYTQGKRCNTLGKHQSEKVLTLKKASGS